jgi:hypothetical protein
VVRDILIPEYDVVRAAGADSRRHRFWPPAEPGRLSLGRAGG